MSFCLLTPPSSKFSKEQSPSWIMMTEFRLGEHGTGHSHTSPRVCAKALESCLTFFNPMDYSPPDSSIHGFSRQEYWSGLPCPPPGFFPTQGSNPGLFHCRQILYHWATREVPPVPATVINSERKGRAEIRAQLLKHFLNNQKNVHYNMGSHLTVMTSKQETQIASRHI